MLNRIFKVTAVSLLTCFIAYAQHTKPPKLVVGLVVDQMRWDYLARNGSRFVSGGFKRLLKQGFSCEQAKINYLPAFTACGHASIFTGTFPAIHGITGNEWITAKGNNYCTADTAFSTVGSNTAAGKMSPKALLTTTIGDELKLATNFKAKVIGISLKDRAAILPAGHSADAAYWFDEQTGNWISSSYYLKNLPEWMNSFNERKMALQYLSNGWQPLYTIASYIQSAPDQSAFEGKFGIAAKTEFPYQFIKDGQVSFSTLKTTPFANEITLELAKQAIIGENLGKDINPDLLTVSLSGTDYVGHHFGPNSIEIEDTYLRLDRDLAKFLNFLDAAVGKANYLIFLTADHGGAHNPAYLNSKRIPAGYWDAKDLQRRLNEHFYLKYGVDNLVQPFLNYQLYFNQGLIEANTISIDSLKNEAITFMNKEPGIAYVLDLSKPSQNIPSAIGSKIINGYHANRSGALQLILEPAWFQLSNDKTGTIHGSWNNYDTHIPLLFMGKGVKRGKLHREVSITDIAPTVCTLLQIQQPNGATGKVIVEVIK